MAVYTLIIPVLELAWVNSKPAWSTEGDFVSTKQNKLTILLQQCFIKLKFNFK